MITINGVKWQIKFVSPFNSNLYTSSGAKALGCCDNCNKIIYINKYLNPIQLKIVLRHELTHAVIYSYDIFMSCQEEEKIAYVISYYGEEIIDLTKQIYKKKKG